MKIFKIFDIKYKYRKTKWWSIVHYNYFHRKLYKEFYVQNKKFTPRQVFKYRIYQKLDNLITLRNVEWLRIFIWKIGD